MKTLDLLKPRPIGRPHSGRGRVRHRISALYGARGLCAVAVAALLSAGCVPHHGHPHRAPHVHNPAQGLGLAVGYLIMSPVLIVAGLLEGIATAPYFVDTDLHAMDRSMKAADSRVTMDETYRHAYGRPLDQVPPSGDTGKVFRHMSEATAHFHNVLRGYGVADYDRYVLTAVRTADRAGYTLYGLVYRSQKYIHVVDRSGQTRTLTSGDRAYYRPYERDASGRPLDVVIDWAGVPRTTIKTQKGQAILLTLAANSVLINRRSDGYWSIERRWMAGEYEAVANERKAQLDRRMSASS
jgi:hypothetical protein